MIMTSGTVSYAPPVCPDNPLAPAKCGEKNDGVAAQLDVVPEGRLRFVGERSDRRVELERLQFA